MIYDCVFLKTGGLVIAKHTGWVWSEKELNEFDIIQSGDLQPSEVDYEVTVGNYTVMASEIDTSLSMEVTE